MIGRAVVQVWIVAALAGPVVLAAPPGEGGRAQQHAPPVRRLAFHGEFTGVAPDHQGSVWEGAVAGEGTVRARLTVEFRQVEGPTEAASPVWHVTTRWSVDDPAGAHSFQAELEGMNDWQSGAIRLGGLITDGWMQGAWMQAEGRFVRGDPTGTLLVVPGVARR